LLLNRSVLMIVSMDKSIYNLLETAHIKGTVTNLTPTPISIHLNHPGVLVKLNGTKLFWAQPTDFITGGFGASWSESIQLGPGETATIDYLTADWNLVGIQLEGGRPVTRGFIPAGNYSITWRADMQDGFQETATFEFIK
jgi:hypothetical protein